MWRARAPDPEQIRRLRAARDRFDLHPLVIHANYLINLASQDPVIRAKSIEGFRGEMECAVAIGAEYLVVHPGSYRGQSVEEGVAAVALALRTAAEATAFLRGTDRASGEHRRLRRRAGSRFEDSIHPRELTRDLTSMPLGICIDTCHLLAAGFDIVSTAGLRDTLRHAEVTLGLENIRVIHANDSKMRRGSRVNRHANIGQGYIGREAFQRILTHPKLRAKPFILETPVDEPGDDRRNLDTLKALAASRRTTARSV